jgi:predicted TIM-barrel fold metal-dependent hydrolase
LAHDLLRNADRSTREAGLDRMLVVDADVHHLRLLKALGEYMDEPWRRLFEHASLDELKPTASGATVTMAGRLQRPPRSHHSASADQERPPRAIRALVEDLGRLGVDCSIVFPQDLFDIGWHPQNELEVVVMRAYCRWVTERVLPYEPRVRVLLPLPFGDAAASLALVEEYGATPGIVGVMVAAKRAARVHTDEYMPVYAAIEERGLVFGMHGGTAWWGRPWRLFDTYLGVHTMFFPTWTGIHLTNILLSGIPERFPRLRFVFYECGAAWLPMLMARLDTAFLMRPSEAPLLRRRPSEYMREFFYTVQPLEQPERPEQMRGIFQQIGTSQILFASDYPHWDFDMPNSITNLGFLSEQEKRDIMGLNAVRVFGLDLAAFVGAGEASASTAP